MESIHPRVCFDNDISPWSTPTSVSYERFVNARAFDKGQSKVAHLGGNIAIAIVWFIIIWVHNIWHNDWNTRCRCHLHLLFNNIVRSAHACITQCLHAAHNATMPTCTHSLFNTSHIRAHHAIGASPLSPRRHNDTRWCIHARAHQHMYTISNMTRGVL